MDIEAFKDLSLVDKIKNIDKLRADDIEIRENAEVATPYRLRQDMIGLVEKYGDAEFWSTPKKVLEPTCGKGGFLLDIVAKFMAGLEGEEKDEDERYRIIVEECLYFADINAKNIYICKLLLDPYGKYRLNAYCGDSLQQEYPCKFDLVIGNPPYNENSENSNGYKVCLYNLFVEKYINLATKLIFVIPSRWFASNGKIEKFRKMMLNRKDIRMIKHCPNSKDIFKNVDIEGGICYFFIDYKYSGLCEFNGIKLNLNKYDILVESRNYSIIEKIIKYSNFEDIYRSKGYFGVSLTNTNLKNTKTIDDEIVVYMSKQKGFIKYIDKKHITKNITKWKVITPSANGKRPCFGNIFIGKPNEVYSESYIGFEVKNEIEADSLLSYLKCKTTNFLLALRKNTQNISLKTLKWIPSVPLDRIWSDEQLYEYFNLHEVEINLINLGKV